MKDFWQNIPKPIWALAPMEDVTDSVFRQIVLACAAPRVFFTEFTSVDGIFSRGRDRVMHRLQFTQKERPIIAQLWGLVPENYFKAARLVSEMGFDGIDINMGCPERSIVRKGACAALIKNPKLASEIIKATQEGAGDLPVSVKTRIGYNQIATEEWIGFLLKHNLDCLTVHGRTAKEMSVPSAHWDEIAKAVKLRDDICPRTIVLGNGDVVDVQDGFQKVEQFGVDGVMVGRGIFKNIFAFETKKQQKTLLEMIELLRSHMHLFVATWGDKKNFLVLRRFFKIYVSGFEGASDLRVKLMTTKNIDEVEKILKSYIPSVSSQPTSGVSS